MPSATFYNKRLLGHVDDTDFTDYQGIGSDPLYKRFKSVESVVKKNISSEYQSFLSCPYYEDGNIYWYVDEWYDIPKSFTELSGIEKERYSQIKDKTIQHYKNVLNKLGAEEYVILNGALKYICDEFIYCYDGKVVLIAWGMRPDSEKHVVNGKWFKTTARLDKKVITFDIGNHGKLDTTIEGVPYLSTINREKGHRIVSRDIPVVIANDGYEFIGWDPNPIGYEVSEDYTFTAKYKKVESPVSSEHPESKVRVSFDPGSFGTLNGASMFEVPKGHILGAQEIPNVLPNVGYKFSRWNPAINQPIDSDTLFTADYSQELAKCSFLAGEHGSLLGSSEVLKPFGLTLLSSEIPTVKPHKGYKFVGWDINPMSALRGDRICTAQYKQVLPWYKRFWLWITGFFVGKGCLKWVLWLLLLILLCWLLSWLLRGCSGVGIIDGTGNTILPDDRVEKIEQIPGPDGVIHDNNGTITGIVGEDGNLPNNGVVSPIVSEDGTTPPVVSNPGTPDVIENRLNIYFESEQADLNKWAHDFKRLYPSNEYQIIGYDPNVKMIQIQIPSDQRNIVREELPNKITDQEFFVVDESIMTLHGQESTSNDNAPKGWHLKATHVKEAWEITKGDPNVVIAIIDDGIDVSHKMFKGRFYKAYNVFTQNRALSPGQGHGTHVAGLAAGSVDFYNQGAAGVAPNCKIMPVQVFDNGMCTFSSMASGIMYAIHNGADVVNVSVGPSFPGLDKLPVDEQIKVANQYFKNEERVFMHIIKTAKEKNVILVFAAGNDNIVTAILPECRSAMNTINVAACTADFKSSDFTNYLLGTNVSAPGVNIYSAYPSNSFKMFDGTSMSAPIISGTIALMKTYKKDITAKQSIAVIQNTGQELDKFIPPMVLIDKAVQAVKDGEIPSEPTWTQRLDQGSIEHVGSIPDNSEVESSIGTMPTDDYSSLRDLLKQLIEQRDELNQRINEIENKLK